MRRLRDARDFLERNGGPEVLEPRDVPEPAPAEGQVVVEVEAIGVNYRDVYERNGGYGSKPPAIIGAEGAGNVAGTGERVAWSNVPGSYAERVVADPDQLVPIPDGVSTETAAAAMLQGNDRALPRLRLVPDRGGRLGAGARSLGRRRAAAHADREVARRPRDRHDLLRREGGARAAGGRGRGDRLRRLRRARQEITGGEGVAAVYDGVGKTTFLDGFKALRPTGRMILYGAASGRPDPLDTASLAAAGSLYVQRPTLNTYTRTPELLRDRARQLFELVEAGKLDVRIGGRYPLDEARRAHEDFEARRTSGKLLLVPN